jgi:adsorption protein B
MDNGDENVINIREHVPILLNPKMKTEGIFNDENLTEDYELGFRFHQLGLKMGFFNVKLDSQNESTRISTAEFFPNTFWSSVKQRSRWIAGICLQNWKAHKWQGNIVTKYFLFRDRKPLFSLFGAFFSNVIFIYFIYTVLNNFFDFGPSVTLVKTGSPLWFLMIAILVFMVSRVFHRFIFTYNWYGFRFAFFSLSRLVLDTFVNFFAVLRAIKVFRQTKKKVVWDSTAHY